MKSMTSAILSIAVSLSMIFPATVFAETQNGLIQGQEGNVPATGTGSGSALGGSSYAPTTITQPTTTRTTGIENNGKDGSEKQGGGSNMAMITMVAMAAVAAATCPACTKRGTCGICAASIMGGLAAGLAGSKMDKAQGLSNSQVTDVNPTAPINGGETPVATENKPEYLAAMKSLKTSAKNIGANVSKDGTKMTTAAGEVLDPTKPNSASNYRPTASESSMVNAALAKAKEDMGKGADGAASVAAEGDGTEGGGGAGGSETRTALADEGIGAGSGAASGRRPASVAGMSRDFNGDRIGVAQDSLFEMLHRRYQVHNNNNSFIPSK